MRRSVRGVHGAAEGPVRQRRHRMRRLALSGHQRRLRGHGRRFRGDQGAGHRPVRERDSTTPGSPSWPSTTATSGRAAGSRARSCASASSSPTGRPRSPSPGTLPGVDPATDRASGASPRPAGTSSASRRDNPELAAAIAQTPNADGPAPPATRCATRGRSRRCASPAGASLDALGALVGRAPAAGAAGRRRREPSRCSPRRMPGTATGRSTRTAATRTGDRRSPPARRSGSGSTGRAGTRPGCAARCWSSSAIRTSRRWPAPAVRAARRAPHGELVRLPGGHYAPFLDGHEPAVAAELSFLRRHLLEQQPAAPCPRIWPGSEAAAMKQDRAVGRDDRIRGHRRRRAGDRAAARAADGRLAVGRGRSPALPAGSPVRGADAAARRAPARDARRRRPVAARG